MKVADEFLLVGRADGTFDDCFEGFFWAMEGNPSLMKHADNAEIRFGLSQEPMSPNAKARLKQILSDPDPGNPFKLDVPDEYLAGEPFPIPHNYWARGNLIEVYQFNKVYKPQGFTHHPNAAGFDYKGTGNNPTWVQKKSVADPTNANAIDRMKKAIDDLVGAAGINNNNPLILHVVTQGADSTAMRSALSTHVAGKPYESRITIQIEQFVNP